MPKTCLRPDVAGEYKVRLHIDDGCATWQGATVTIKAECHPLPSMEDVMDSLSFYDSQTSKAAVTSSTQPLGKTGNWTLDVDGNIYDRITIATKVVPKPTGNQPNYDVYTFKWTVNSMIGSNTAVVNQDGNVLSFVPSQPPKTQTGYQNPATGLVYSIVLSISSACWDNSASMGRKMMTYPMTVKVNCKTGLTSDAFNFGNTVVQSYTNPVANTATANTVNRWWQISTTSTLSNVYNNYYAPQMTMPASMTTPMTTPGCSTSGPFCAPYSSSAVPTILYGGSTIDNQYLNAGFQNYYFQVPGTLNPEKATCKIVKTYWMLTGYENSINFYPVYTPGTVLPPPNVTCFPEQTWSLSITGTPCSTCSVNGQSSIRETCLFEKYQEFFSAQMVNTPTSLNAVVSRYTQPNFYIQNTNNIVQPSTVTYMGTQQTIPGGGYCIYGSNTVSGSISVPGRLMNLDGSISVMNDYVANCLVSGKGREISLKSGFTTTPGSTCAANSLRTCYMSEINFVPSFPGNYELTLMIYDGCGIPQTTTVTVHARCATQPQKLALSNPTVNSFYYCQQNGNKWGSVQGGGGANVAQGYFTPHTLSELIPKTPTVATAPPSDVVSSGGVPDEITVNEKQACPVTLQTNHLRNCSDVKNYVNADTQLQVDTTAGDKFKACCTCLYGQNTINVFSVPGSSSPSNRNKEQPTPSSANVLALTEGQYTTNFNLLIGLVVPLAVILVFSIAGNILMVLKLRQAGSAGAYNVRAGDVELSTSPRARVDV